MVQALANLFVFVFVFVFWDGLGAHQIDRRAPMGQPKWGDLTRGDGRVRRRRDVEYQNVLPEIR